MVKKKQQYMTWALKDEKMVHVDEVERGLKCGCICPACGEPLIAKQGEKKTHHFAHQSTVNCEYGYESSLHLLSKEILSETQIFRIPPVEVHFRESHKLPVEVSDSKDIKIDEVKLEHRIGGIIPDVVLYSGEKEFLVEIYVTHRVDEEKLEKIRALDISVIEIDLSNQETISKEMLREILINGIEKKEWLFNRVEDRYYKEFCKFSEKKKIINRGMALHVDYCPRNARIWKGKSYANFIDDCTGCPYWVSQDYEQQYMLCIGKSNIDTLDDLKAAIKREKERGKRTP